MSLSIIMPCYNEEEIIEKVVRSYYAEIQSRIDDFEFIVIDDCSKDNTLTKLQVLSKELPKLKILRPTVNGGHGKALRMGYETACKEWVFQVDSDNQFEIKEFWKLDSMKNRYDFIVGYRKHRHDPLTRLILTEIIRISNFILFGVWIKDANCPFRLIKNDLLKQLLKSVDKNLFAPNIALSILAARKNNKLTTLPVTHYERKTGTCTIKKMKLIKSSLKGLRELFEMRKGLSNTDRS